MQSPVELINILRDLPTPVELTMDEGYNALILATLTSELFTHNFLSVPNVPFLELLPWKETNLPVIFARDILGCAPNTYYAHSTPNYDTKLFDAFWIPPKFTENLAKNT